MLIYWGFFETRAGSESHIHHTPDVIALLSSHPRQKSYYFTGFSGTIRFRARRGRLSDGSGAEKIDICASSKVE